VCFPEGHAGTHGLLNRSESVARALFLSTTGLPANICYPDTGRWSMLNEPGDDAQPEAVARSSAAFVSGP
jgi:uncharacterized cupin superfamily protein